MFKISSIKNRNLWDNLIKNRNLPNYFTEIINIEFKDFKTQMDKSSSEYQKDLIQKIFSGAIIQITNALNNELIDEILNESLRLSKTNVSKKTLCVEGCEDYFFLQTDDLSKKGGYKALDRSYYFFPWNLSQKNLFNSVYKYWRYLKVLGGLNFDEYEDKTPKDGVINRLHVIQYLKGGGTISPHKDTIQYQKIQVGSVLNEYSKDFDSGGFAVFNKKKEKVLIEPKLKKGSLVCFMPSLYHTVDPIDPNKKIDFSKPDGRWYLSLTCVGSDHLKDRKKTTAINF
jgi:hypothetical protein|tara:strand:- start:4915 stop:5769 length:855 start_codon:yes stop_codon:yes gene_type:complete